MTPERSAVGSTPLAGASRFTPAAGGGSVFGVRAVFAGLGLSVLLVGHARAFECKRSEGPSAASLTWPNRQISFGVVADPNESLSAIQSALSAWSTLECSDLEFDFRGIVTPDTDVNGSVRFVESAWSEAGRPPEAVGLTTTSYNRANGAILDSRIEINRAGFQFGEGERCASGDPVFDLQSVLTHEVGHLVGLDHTQVLFGDRRDPTMAPTIRVCEDDKRTLEPDDRDAICTLYPRGRANGSCTTFEETSSLIGNRAFGCQTGAGGSPSLQHLLWAPLLLFWARARRPCSRPRSAR